MTYLLDTDTCIGVLRQRPGMVQRLRQLAPTDCAVSTVTVYELFCGVAKAQDPPQERQKVERFIGAIIELPLDRAALMKKHRGKEGTFLSLIPRIKSSSANMSMTTSPSARLILPLLSVI